MIHLSMEEGKLRIDAGPMATSRLRTLQGIRSHPKVDPPYWTVTPTYLHAKVLRKMFGADIAMTDDVKRFFLTQKQRWENRKNRLIPSWDLGDLYEYQKVGVGRLTLPGGAFLFDDVGLGKTAEALSALEQYPALVITPKSVKSEWVREATRWAPNARPIVIAGTQAQREKQFAEALETPFALVIISWDLLRKHSRLAGYGGQAMAEGEGDDKELQQFGFRTVIADEAHRAKDPKAKWSRALWALGDEALYRWAVTATPIGNEHADLWSLLRFIEPEMFPSKSKFVDRYIDMVALPWANEPIGLKDENRDEFNEIMDVYMIRRTAKEIPELANKVPELREMRRDIELSPKQKAAYKSMKKEMMATIGDELLMAANPLVLLSRLKYIAAAMPVVSEEGQVVELELPSNKIAVLKEMLENGEIPLPTVVLMESSKLCQLAYETLGDSSQSSAYIDGSVVEGDRKYIIERFQDGKIDVLFGTTAIAEGVNLHRGASQVFLQLPSSLIKWVQMSGRVARIGNERPIIPNFLLLSEGTVDQVIYDVIVAKTERLEDVVRDKSRIFGTL
jgi:SNF2 family DNA or RNA helicase